MRWVKTNDGWQVTIPEPTREKAKAKEEEEWDSFAIEPGVIVLVSRGALEHKIRSQLVAELTKRTGVQTPFQPAATAARNPSPAAPAFGSFETGFEDTLKNKGYLVLDNEAAAKSVSVRLEKEIKENRVIGVRAFDKKFYIVSIAYYQAFAPKITALITRGVQASADIAKELNVEEFAVLAVLNVMKDAGDVIERKKGQFALVT